MTLGSRRVRLVLLAAVALLLGALAWGALASIRAKADVVRAHDRLEELRDDEEPADEAAVRAALDDARADLRRARSWLRAPGPRLAARVPLLGRSVVATRAATDGAATVVDATARVLDAAASDVPLLREGRLDLTRLAAIRDTLAAAGTDVDRAAARLRGLDTGWTPPQVGRGVRDARAVVDEAAAGFGKGRDLLTAVLGVTGADGPRRLLVLLENNAELRGTGGLVSVFAEATADRGVVTIGRFRDVDEVSDHRTKARPVAAPQDYRDLYGTYLANTTLWKNANMSPDGPTSLGVVAALAGLSVGQRPDAVLALDVPAIAAILHETGPARLPDGRELTGDNAVRRLLVSAYEGVPDTREGQAVRRRRLREAADAVVARLLSGSASSVPLATGLSRAAAGRHLMLWSADPAEQALLERAGVAGAVRAGDGDLAMVTLQNFGGGRLEGNKLDYYARRALSVNVRVGEDETVTEQVFTLRNDAPATGLSAYVAGLERPGATRNYLTFAVPAGARLLAFDRDGRPAPTTLQPERDYRVLTDFVELDRGEKATWTLRYALPRRGDYRLRVVPQPLAVDATLAVDVEAADGLDLRGDTGREDGAWTADETLVAEVVGEPWWTRTGRAVRRFWTEPVFD